MRIDYTKPWLQQHERAFISAYRTSAFFEYYQDELFAILESRPQTLFELNTALTVKLLELLGLRCRVSFTGEYVQEYGPDVELLGLRCRVSFTGEYVQEYGPDVLDLREAIHPKKTVPEMFRNSFKPYYQVFYEKFGFIPGLSALDLLFNEGPNALSFL